MYPKPPTDTEIQRANDRITERSRELDAEHEAALAKARAENAEARERYQAKLAAERERKAAEDRAEVDARLAPAMAAAKRDWLIDHPNASEADFEKVAPAVRERLLEEERNAVLNHDRDVLRSRYGVL